MNQEIEVQVQESLEHCNILRVLSSEKDETHIHIYLEYADGGDLSTKIGPSGLDDEMSVFYFNQLISGVKYMHTHGVVHRDLKPQNLLLNGDNVLKIADFGLTAKLEDRKTYLSEVYGTRGYMAPEVFSARYRGEPSDVWSCGVTLVKMMSGSAPWEVAKAYDPNYQIWLRKDLKLTDSKPWIHICKSAMDLIKSLLHPVPSGRATIQEIEQHDFVANPASHGTPAPGRDPTPRGTPSCATHIDDPLGGPPEARGTTRAGPIEVHRSSSGSNDLTPASHFRHIWFKPSRSQGDAMEMNEIPWRQSESLSHDSWSLVLREDFARRNHDLQPLEQGTGGRVDLRREFEKQFGLCRLQQPNKDWIEVRELGEGAYGSVVLLKKATSEVFVAKKSIELEGGMNQQIEVQVQESLEHRNILRVLSSEKDETHIHIYLEYADGGDLSRKIGPSGLDDEMSVFYFNQLISGVKYMHTHGVVHRDLKPQNLLLNGDNVLKIADFGLAAKLEDRKTYLSEVNGTRGYMAPEVFSARYRGEPSDHLPPPSLSLFLLSLLLLLLIGTTLVNFQS
ncbi:putative ribosomal protein S6 kinase alpha-1 [Oratosquilla oratoria]|uniref:putative ribosomal protein S6 kinase alpha-1 n=1 Tax=Oratosquilla oratoria TaxID=337810 RepID=UPI003F7781F9